MTTAKNNKTVVVRYGFGPLTMLGFIFVLCKIFAVGPVAAWSWWLVLLPFYLGFAILLAIFAAGLVIAAVGALLFGGLVMVESFFAKRRLKQLQADIAARRRF